MDSTTYPTNSYSRPNTSSTTTFSQTEADSSSSNHGWSFLQTRSHNDPNGSPRSLPPSTYMRSSNSASSRSPVQNASFHSQAPSRSLLNQFSTSTGHRSTTTSPSLPSQPVLLRINSNNAYTHTSLVPRRTQPGRPVCRDKATQLPALEEFSIQGILSAVEEDIETDLAVISEVLGRSRFVLADQYESQMAPLGEIRGDDMLGEEENFRSVDDVLIVREDASLVDGSNSGSAAYGLLERLQAVPRTANNLGVGAERPLMDESSSPRQEIAQLEPAIPAFVPSTTLVETRDPTTTRPNGPAQAVVSATYLSAEADGIGSALGPVMSESGRPYPMNTHDDNDAPEDTASPRETLIPPRRQSFVPGFDGIASWLSRGTRGGANGSGAGSGGGGGCGGAGDAGANDAETRLRGLLNR